MLLIPNPIKDVIAEIRSLTAKPFAMNLWVSMEDAEAHTSDAATFRRALSYLSLYIEVLGGTQPECSPHKPLRFEDQAGVLVESTETTNCAWLQELCAREEFSESLDRLVYSTQVRGIEASVGSPGTELEFAL